MRVRVLIIIILASLSLSLFGDESNDPELNREQSFKNCAVMLSMAANHLADGGRPFNCAPYAETLDKYLYKDSIEVSAGERIFATIALQCYYYLTQDPRLNYKEIETCINATRTITSFMSQSYIFCCISLGEQYRETDFAKSLDYFSLADTANEAVYDGKKSFFTSTILGNLVLLNFKLEEWRKACEYQDKLVRTYVVSEQCNSQYCDALIFLAFLYKQCGEYAKADSCYAKAENQYEYDLSTYRNEYIETVESRIELLQTIGDLDSINAEMQKLSSLLTPEDSEYFTFLFMEAEYYQSIGEYTSLRRVFDKAITYVNTHSVNDWKELFNIVEYLNSFGTEEEKRNMLSALEQPSGDEIGILSARIVLYNTLRQYEELNSALPRLYSIYDTLSEEDKILYSDILSSTFFTIGDYDKGIEMMKLQIESEEQGVKFAAIRASHTYLLSKYHSLNREYAKAEDALTYCRENSKDPELLFNVGKAESELYSDLGNYQKSAESIEQLLSGELTMDQKRELLFDLVGNLICEVDIRNTSIDEESSATTEVLKRKLVDSANELYKLSSHLSGDSSFDALNAQSLLATAYALNGDTVGMLRVSNACETKIRDANMNVNLKSALLESLAMHSYIAGDYKKARQLVDTTILRRQSVAEYELNTTLEFLSEISLAEGKTAEAQEYYRRLASLRKRELSKSMFTMTSANRMRYWRLYKQEMINAPKFADKFDSESSFAGEMYDMSLYSKGLLLNSDIEFRSAILNGEDSFLKEKLRMLSNMRIKLQQESNEALRAEADKLEKELLSALPDKNSEYSVSWRDIRNVLKNGEMAVEMVLYSDVNNVRKYGAIILRKDSEYPIFTVIGEQHTIDTLIEQTMDNGKYQTSGVWNFIEPYIQGIEKIYFSASGIYHKSPIESMYSDDSISFYRLSSTAELLKPTNGNVTNAVIYGGITYSTSVDKIVKDAENYPRKRSIDSYVENYRGSKVELSELPGTKEEAEQIEVQMKGSLNVKLFEGDNATEASIKNLDGSEVNVLHIATHGFYKHNSVSTSGSKLSQSFAKATEDALLTESGLMFAGVDNTSRNSELPEGIENGILTAQEVSTLDLHNLELVTLSACETALGNVTGDGVFGLQRGFKKAGAKSILMSLWRVDDESTVCLMKTFYELWMGGETKHDALEGAKQRVRSNPQWSDPIYWAPFILLDSIN